MPEITREYRTTTKRTRALLEKQEGLDCDFKVDLKGLHPEDLIAFANSSDGGAILVGVDEVEDENGQQRGKIVGCLVGDGERLIIHNKAEDCIPPVEVQIYIENTGTDKPFFRIEIPSSSHKPHCTKKGTYKIRGDGRTKALLPNRLLAIFMAAEGEEFVRRFAQATKDLETRLSTVGQDLTDRIHEMSFEAQAALREIFGVAENAASLSDDAMVRSDEAAGGVEHLVNEVEELKRSHFDLHRRVLAALEALRVEDPVAAEIRENVRRWLTRKKEDHPEMDWRELAMQVREYFPRLPMGYVDGIARGMFGR